MLRNRLCCLLAAAVCIPALTGRAMAAEVDSGQVYCFSAEDFSEDVSIEGIYITELPQAGALMLGSRVLQAGDVLTAGQAAQMTFAPLESEDDRTAQVGYLPIFRDRVEEGAAMTISIRGKGDKAPIAEDSALETYKNLPNTGKLKVTEPEGQAMTFTVTRQPRRGSVTIGEDGSFTYTPKKNKVGVDSFVYTAADPAGNVSREATVTITILKPSDAPQYTDTMGKDCCFAAEWMKHTGIFVGETVGDSSCFSPDKEVTRGEFVTMLVKALDIPVEEDVVYTGCTDEIPTWLQPYVAASIRSGLTAGLPNQEVFGAGEILTGAEAAVMLQNGLDLTAQVLSSEEDGAPEWAAASLNALNASGFALQWDTAMTRGDAARILYQAAKLAQQAKLIQ